MSKPWYSLALAVCVAAAPLAAPLRAAEEKKGYLGVQIRKDDDSDKIMVVSLDDDGPAKKAGLEPGDTFVMIGDLKPTDLPTVVKFVQGLKPGMKIKVRVERGGQEKEIEVTIGER
jgi:C-terminal processing protease CtpA/Prc